MSRKNVMAVSRTGDGKSSFCKALARQQGSNNPPFVNSSAATSHTQAPVSFDIGNLKIVDTPGLMDTGGVTKDEANIRVIVDHARPLSQMHAFFLVLNEQATRFDDGMQESVKLLVDSFGPQFLQHLGVVFTKSYGSKTLADVQTELKSICGMITKKTGQTVTHLPCWQIDCFPEELVNIGVPSSSIPALQAKTNKTLAEIVRWVDTMTPMSTTEAVYGEYEARKKAREAAAAAEAARKQAEHERYQRSVIRTDTETRTVEVSRVTVPIMANREVIVGWKRRGGFAGLMGEEKPIYGNQQYQSGSRIDVTRREERRSNQVLGSGQVVYGGWTTVRQFTESA